MDQDLWLEYSRENRRFANFEFVGYMREFMIEFRENEYLRKLQSKKRKNNSIKTK